MNKIRSVKVPAEIDKDLTEYLKTNKKSFNGLVIKHLKTLLYGKAKNARSGSTPGRRTS
jgi:hypothetical protein